MVTEVNPDEERLSIKIFGTTDPVAVDSSRPFGIYTRYYIVSIPDTRRESFLRHVL